jgi:hypothetical protein
MTTIPRHMFIARRRLPFADHLQRLFAVGSVALVLLLTVLAASPAAHEWIHGHAEGAAQTAGADEDGCVVTLFAHGAFSAVVFAALLIVCFFPIAVVPGSRETPGRSVPRYWLPPLCGPPRG